ncbi:hypothetical protein D3C76_1655580 [compost metagenome]
MSEDNQVLIQGMGFCLAPMKAGCRPTALMRRLVMYSTYWQRMSLFRPIMEPSWNRYSAHSFS